MVPTTKAQEKKMPLVTHKGANGSLAIGGISDYVISFHFR